MRLPSKSIATDENLIRQDICETIDASLVKITPSALEKHFFQKYGLSKKHIKYLIRDLIVKGELTYSYQYGCTFLERSFNRPVRISQYVVIKPPGRQYDAYPDDVIIQILPGASFGIGDHPTTRLAVRGIEHAIRRGVYCSEHNKKICLDVGTGSGILVIAAVKFGIKNGIGIDVDPCARAEARGNVRINGLQKQIQISGQSADTLEHRFWMITANLRYPSLIQLCPLFSGLIDPEGLVILSGIKFEEFAGLIKVYTDASFVCLWREIEKGWVGVAFKNSKK
ncbi:MAG: 50S ribosomal protein L11 methyltransferase [Deltaproteobacteria bacterium]|nr:MAG: 50S ribosomal protein L11 methyltransferase [Deltaproteobacteria bacterium]